jgi:hypothetical protein
LCDYGSPAICSKFDLSCQLILILNDKYNEMKGA